MAFQCAARKCTYQGVQTKWPQLVGLPGPQCKAIIERDNPYVIVIYVPRNGGTIDAYYCCNRVYLFVDENNICYFPPVVG